MGRRQVGINVRENWNDTEYTRGVHCIVGHGYCRADRSSVLSAEAHHFHASSYGYCYYYGYCYCYTCTYDEACGRYFRYSYNHDYRPG